MTPTQIKLAIAAGLIVLAGYGVYTYGESRFADGQSDVQAEWDKAKLAQQDVATTALMDKLHETQRRLQEAEEKDHDDQAQLAAVRNTADAARAAEQRVRQQLARLPAPGGCARSGDPTAPAPGAADTAIRALYAACLAEYRSLGEQAAADRVGWGSCVARYDSLTQKHKTSGTAPGIITSERPTNGGPDARF